MRVLIALVFFVAACAQGDCTTLECYESERAALVALDEASLLGGNDALSAQEKAVEATLQQLRADLVASFVDPPLPQRNWRDLEDWARATKLYQLFQAMPKGAVLHAHGFVDMRFAVSVGTYLSTCFVDLRPGSRSYGTFAYAADPTAPPAGWTGTVAARANVSDVPAFDAMLWNLTQFRTPPLSVNETTVWYTFDHTIQRAFSLLLEPSVARAVIMQAFKTYVAHGMQHIELRVSLSMGSVWIDAFSAALAQFNAENNQTLSARFIVQQLRHSPDSQVLDTMMAKDREQRYASAQTLLDDLAHMGL